MTFGQAGGPPASNQQISALADLLGAAGYGDFREARHPYGLTQRQSNGKFARAEAAELIARLEAEGSVRPVELATPGPSHGDASPRRRAMRQTRPGNSAAPDLTTVPDDDLVEELGRRGWICSPPL